MRHILMPNDQIAHAIDLKKVPKTELDSAWNQVFGYSLFGILFICAFFTLLKAATIGNLIFFSTATLLLLILFYFYATERKLKSRQNLLNKKQNSQLIEKALTSLKWKFEKNDSMYFCEVPFLFGQAGFHLTVFPLDNEILYNLRNIGSSKGRLPFLYGLETLKRKNFESALNNFA